MKVQWIKDVGTNPSMHYPLCDVWLLQQFTGCQFLVEETLRKLVEVICRTAPPIIQSWKYNHATVLERLLHVSGQLAHEKRWKDGELDGVWRWWHDNGQLMREETWKDGVCRGWHHNG